VVREDDGESVGVVDREPEENEKFEEDSDSEKRMSRQSGPVSEGKCRESDEEERSEEGNEESAG
jgi:hypothetical protein